MSERDKAEFAACLKVAADLYGRPPLSGEALKMFFLLLHNLLDMSSLEALHATYVTAQETCLAEKFNADLRLCWFVDTLELISKEDATNLKDKLVKEVMNGKKYDEVLEEGQIEVFQILKSLQ